MNMNEKNDSLILNPKSNRFVKKTSQTGIRLMKELSVQPSAIPMPIATQPAPQPQPTPIQTSIISACAEIVASQPAKFRDLSPDEMDSLFKKLLLQKLGVKETKKKEKKPELKKKKKAKFKVVSSSSESESESSD